MVEQRNHNPQVGRSIRPAATSLPVEPDGKASGRGPDMTQFDPADRYHLRECGVTDEHNGLQTRQVRVRILALPPSSSERSHSLQRARLGIPRLAFLRCS